MVANYVIAYPVLGGITLCALLISSEQQPPLLQRFIAFAGWPLVWFFALIGLARAFRDE